MLDKWLIRIADENNIQEASKIVNETFQNNIKANIRYYEDLANAADKIHLDKVAATNRLVANLYKVFLTS